VEKTRVVGRRRGGAAIADDSDIVGKQEVRSMRRKRMFGRQIYDAVVPDDCMLVPLVIRRPGSGD
jgi:hypothetical protein